MAIDYPGTFDHVPRISSFLTTAQWVDFKLQYNGETYDPMSSSLSDADKLLLYNNYSEVTFYRDGYAIPEFLEDIDMEAFLESLYEGDLSTYFS